MTTPQTLGEQIAKAIRQTLISPNEADSNGENANVVDGLFAIARALHHVAESLEGAKPDDEKRLYTDEQWALIVKERKGQRATRNCSR